MLLNLLQFDLSGDVGHKLECFDREVARYCSSSKESVSDNIKIGIVIMQLPRGALKHHLILHLDRFTSFQMMRDEIVNVPTTFEAWGTDGQVRVYHEITEEMKPALRFENLLFATGMSPDSGIADIVETELWDQPHQVDPKTGETAQYTGL